MQLYAILFLYDECFKLQSVHYKQVQNGDMLHTYYTAQSRTVFYHMKLLYLCVFLPHDMFIRIILINSNFCSMMLVITKTDNQSNHFLVFFGFIGYYWVLKWPYSVSWFFQPEVNHLFSETLPFTQPPPIPQPIWPHTFLCFNMLIT